MENGDKSGGLCDNLIINKDLTVKCKLEIFVQADINEFCRIKPQFENIYEAMYGSYSEFLKLKKRLRYRIKVLSISNKVKRGGSSIWKKIRDLA